MANFAAAGATKEFYFAHAERREIVVEHEAVELVLREEQVEALHVFLGAEGKGGESLGFTASEERGAMNAREQADFASDLANLVEGAAIGTATFVKNVVTEDFFAEAFKGALGQRALLVHFFLGLFGNGLDDLFLERVDEVIAFFLEMLVDGLIERKRRDNDLFRLELRVKFLDGGDDFLDLRVAEFEGVGDSFFGDFERAGFHHDDGFFGASDDDVHQTFFLVGDSRIDHQLAVKQAHANASNGLFEREVRAISSGGRAGDGDDVGVILAVRGEHHGYDLSLVAPGFREERAHGAVNQAGGEDFFFGGAAFALEKTTGNFSGGVSIFAVVNGERQEVAVVHLRGHASGSQDNGVAVARGNGAIGLLGDFSSFENQRASTDFNGDLVRRGCNCIFRHGQSFPLARHPSRASSGAYMDGP